MDEKFEDNKENKNDCMNFDESEDSCTKLCDSKHCIEYMPKE